MMQNKNQQLKVQFDQLQQNENKGTENKIPQQKIPQLKVHTGIRSGVCWWDYDCQKYWC